MDKKRHTDFTTIRRIAGMGIRKWVASPRTWMVCAMETIFVWISVELIRKFAAQQVLSVSQWYFPLLFTQDNIVYMFIYFGLILLLCNAPFVDAQQIFVLTRSGRRTWFLGQMLYIALSCFLFFAFIALLCVVEFIPYVGFSMNWEMVFTSLADAHVTVDGAYIAGISKRVLDTYTPLQAFGIAFIINVLIGCLLGLLIFYVNLYKSRGYGAAAAFAVVLLSNMVVYIAIYKNPFRFAAPVSWSCIELLCGNANGVPLWYAFTFLLIVNCILAALILHRSKSYNIEALEEI